jgi:hypothetical protein
MKKTILTTIALIVFSISYAQLNNTALTYKKQASKIYDQIVTFAENKWKDDNTMIVYTINKQCDALYKLATEPKYSSYLKAPKGTRKNSQFLKILGQWTEKVNGVPTTDYTMIIYKLDQYIKNSDY